MVAVLVPLAIGLLQGILRQLDVLSASGATFRQWLGWGFVTYVALHVLLYRPVPMFRVSHQMFSVLAVWLFGGQVAPVAGSPGADLGGAGKRGRGGKADMSQGSTLVAFSPYVIPLYAMLVSAGGWVLNQWLPDRVLIDGPVTFLIGFMMAFHWLMTADDLQQQRERWHVETYLLAIGLVFVVTLVIAGACLPWAIPEFSFLRALGDGFTKTQSIYASMVRGLFYP
jgi:hypothetical protein